MFEFQKRGAIHYHLLCNLPFVSSKELAEIWTHGFIKIKKIEDDLMFLQERYKIMKKSI